jgi:hypothetical protein
MCADRNAPNARTSGSIGTRTADGYFTGGRTVNDTWGMRDVMGSGVLLSSGHDPEMGCQMKKTPYGVPPVRHRASVGLLPGFLLGYIWNW